MRGLQLAVWGLLVYAACTISVDLAALLLAARMQEEEDEESSTGSAIVAAMFRKIRRLPQLGQTMALSRCKQMKQLQADERSIISLRARPQPSKKCSNKEHHSSWTPREAWNFMRLLLCWPTLFHALFSQTFNLQRWGRQISYSYHVNYLTRIR